MANPTDKLRTNPLLMAVVLIGFFVIIPVLVIAIGTQDPLWFASGFDRLPYRVMVYHDGQKSEYLPGQEGYDVLAEAARSSLAQGVVRSSGIGLSAASLEDAYQRYTSVEVFFDEPVKLHAAFNTYRPTQMLFLITGRHTDFPIVFMGNDGAYYSNGPILRTTDPLKKVLKDLGYVLIQQ